MGLNKIELQIMKAQGKVSAIRLGQGAVQKVLAGAPGLGCARIPQRLQNRERSSHILQQESERFVPFLHFWRQRQETNLNGAEEAFLSRRKLLLDARQVHFAQQVQSVSP